MVDLLARRFVERGHPSTETRAGPGRGGHLVALARRDLSEPISPLRGVADRFPADMLILECPDRPSGVYPIPVHQSLAERQIGPQPGFQHFSDGRTLAPSVGPTRGIDGGLAQSVSYTHLT